MEEENIVPDPEFSIFWSQIIPAGKTVVLDSPLMSLVTITNAVIPDVSNETEKKVVRVMANIKTLVDDGEEEEDEKKEVSEEQEDSAYITNDVLICTLIPFEKENQSLDILFTPLNIVEFTNQGNLDVHLSGFITPNDEDYEDEEEEEEEEKEEKKDEKKE